MLLSGNSSKAAITPCLASYPGSRLPGSKVGSIPIRGRLEFRRFFEFGLRSFPWLVIESTAEGVSVRRDGEPSGSQARRDTHGWRLNLE